MVQRTFILGDEWCYFKIYTGFKTADTILINSIYPIIQQLKANQIIDNWFFLRYADPKFHLRVRFHVDNLNKIPAVVMNFNQVIREYVNNGLVWKIQADTYNRELERYGENTIELSESLFAHDSEMICKTITLEQVKQNENLRWQLGLKMIDTLLNDFGFSLQEKWELTNTLQDNFGKEFGINTDYRRQFGQKYRTEKQAIEKILNPITEKEDDFQLLFEPIFEKSNQIKDLIAEIKTKVSKNEGFSLQSLVPIYIHMMLNRLFRTQQRMHELVLYDYLFRYYNSLQARQGGKVLETRKKAEVIK